MKFTDGFWHRRPGVDALYAEEAYDIAAQDGALTVHAPTKVIASRGDVLNRAVLTVTLSSPLEGVVKVRIDHHQGARRSPGFEMPGAVDGAGVAQVDDAGGTLTSGRLTARVAAGAPWTLDFEVDGERITGSGQRSVGYMTLGAGAPVPAEPAGVAGYTETGLAPHRAYLHEQLDLGVGETIYGLGERFGPFVKNGQSVDIWHADGGTSSEQAYKSVPFYLSSKGYAVLVNHPEHVSFEVGSEAVERVQFSTAGESLEYLVFAGPTPAEAVERYTALLGRPPRVPAWSFGLWLSTSFTTDYDEDTVTSFVDGMRERDIPLSVFHYDCFWMREFNWTDGVWDERVFPDPDGMLRRMHQDKDLHVSAWINPYIAQRGRMFREGAEKGYLVKRPDGTIWQWDFWQAGMGLVDFTNPAAKAWFQDFIRTLVRQGVDAIKTDFGERVPTDVVWHDGTSPETMHNLYTQLYNQAVWEALVDVKGEGEAVLFARSATAGGQTMPVHWGGDNSSSYVSMAETLRGGLSLMSSGFGYWSHDIGGFEGTPDAGVFKRWLAFGLMSSHSRLHGSNSYRVPWAFDEEAVDVARLFTKLKLSLMPYLYAASVRTTQTGIPMMRPMFLAFPGDPATQHLDRQYMLGDDLLVAPVMSESGDVDLYLPPGEWTSLLTGERVAGGRWVRETHGFDSMPIYVRPGAVIPRGTRDDRPDYDLLAEVELVVYPGGAEERTVVLEGADGSSETVTVESRDGSLTATGTSGRIFAVRAV
ncbi:alpha-xylosidase [Demequina sp.]|uniref:alpha-xylosidase n=1 Tax=Demequina sp. TaxID=2050685 RepID=UPI0025EA2F3E|nr:alpha-xylosidase [Demequina sp.]